MTEDDLSPKVALARSRWSLVHLHELADTATSRVFRADSSDGSQSVLKVLKPYGADEIHGAELMVWYAGDGAASILDIHDDMILMEWLDGAPLGDLVRAGQDGEGTERLCDVVLRLQRPRPNPPVALASLRERFETLFRTEPVFWPMSHRSAFARARDVAVELLDTTAASIPLHGDLHHDNVIGSSRGWLAIDPKGLLGDPAYDLANVFRNPRGANALASSARRIDELADVFSTRLGFARKRILSWAAAHSALSACWDSDAGNSIEWDLTMLPLLLQAVDRA